MHDMQVYKKKLILEIDLKKRFEKGFENKNLKNVVKIET